MLLHEDGQGFVIAIGSFAVSPCDIKEVSQMVIGDSERVVIAGGFDDRNGFAQDRFRFVEPVHSDERGGTLGLADSRFVRTSEPGLYFPSAGSIIQRLRELPLMLVHLGRHAVDDRFSRQIIRFLHIFDGAQDILLRFGRLSHGHVYAREGVIRGGDVIGISALDVQFVAAFGIERGFVEIAEAHIDQTE